MAASSIPVDLFNPGQVFACLGFLEAAEALLGDAAGGFEWEDGEAMFVIAAKTDPVDAVLAFLRSAEVRTRTPDSEKLSTERWSVATDRIADSDPFPFHPPPSPATLPAMLVGSGPGGEATRIPLEYWGDSTDRDNVKFWAGAGGYPGAALARDALDLIRAGDYGTEHIFDVAAPQSSSFRFDWRRDYIAIDTGFAVNDHGDITMVGYPLVEIMAAIGVTHARPQRIDKLHYRYGVVGSGAKDSLLPPPLLRAALGCAPLPFPQRTFSMHLDWPGQEGQARCITDVTEEPIA
jgi:CRISPR-associated protein Csx14